MSSFTVFPFIAKIGVMSLITFWLANRTSFCVRSLWMDVRLIVAKIEIHAIIYKQKNLRYIGKDPLNWEGSLPHQRPNQHFMKSFNVVAGIVFSFSNRKFFLVHMEYFKFWLNRSYESMRTSCAHLGIVEP